MYLLIPDQFWLGHALDARSPRQLLEAGIEAVIDIAYEELPAQLPRQLVYCRFPLNDGGGNSTSMLEQAVRTTAAMLDNGTPTLISCSAGLSRSPAIAAFSLAKFRGTNPRDELDAIAAIKPLDLNAQLWQTLESVFN